MIIWALFHVGFDSASAFVEERAVLIDRCARSAEGARQVAYDKYPDSHRTLDQDYRPVAFTLERVP